MLPHCRDATGSLVCANVLLSLSVCGSQMMQTTSPRRCCSRRPFHAGFRERLASTCVVTLLSWTWSVKELYAQQPVFRCSVLRLVHVCLSDCSLRGYPKKYPNTKTNISQKCAIIFVLNFVHLFKRQLCKSVLLWAVST